MWVFILKSANTLLIDYKKEYTMVTNASAIQESDFYKGETDMVSILNRSLDVFEEICKLKVNNGKEGNVITIYSEEVVDYYFCKQN